MIKTCLLPRVFLFAIVCLMSQMAWAGTIHISSINSEADDEIKKFLPLTKYLEMKLKQEGIDQVKLVVVRSIPELASLIRNGKVDLYIDSPFPSEAVRRLSGTTFLLRRWKKGIGEYRSVIFARKESNIHRLEDLRGKIIAFEDPSSSSGYFLPKLALKEKGIDSVHKQTPSDLPESNEVGYVFSNSDENTMLWVLKGKTSVGAMDNQNFQKYAKNKLENLKIIHETFSLPRHIVSHRANLSPKLVARIKEILIQMDQSDEGRKALLDFETTTKFDEIPPGAMDPLLKFEKFIDIEFGIK